MQDDTRENRFARNAAIALLCLLTVGSLIRFRLLYPHFIDTFYHMAAIEGMRQAGGLVLWDFWEYAPAGRPQFYPPGLHVAGLLATVPRVSPWGFVTFISWAMWPLSLLLGWLLVRKIAGDRAAFLSMALLAGPGFWFFQQAAHTANAAALCLALGSLLLFLSNRFWASGVLSVLAVAMHGGGIVAPVAIVLVAAPSPRLLLRRALPIALVSILAFCPWALHMYKHTALAGLRHGTLQLEMFRVDLVLLPLALCGFVWLVRDTLRAMRRRSSEDAVPSFALPAFALSFGVMFPMAYGHRYWAFVSILSYALLGGVAADRLLGLWTPRSRRARAALLIAATGLALVFLPTWRPWPSSLPRRGPQPAHGRPRREPAKIGFRLGRPALAILATGHDSSLGKPGRPPWELRDAFALTRPVLGPGDLVFMRGSEACLLTAVTGAWTCGGMLAEVISPEPPSTPEECDYVLQVPTRRLPQDTDAGSPNRMRTTFPAPPGFEIVPLPGIGDQKTAAPPERLGLYVPRLSRSLSRTPERRDPSPAAVPMPVVLIGVAGLAAVALSDVLRGRSHPSLRTVACVLGVVAFAVFWSWLFVRVVQEEPSVRPEWRQAFEPPHASPGVPDQK